MDMKVNRKTKKPGPCLNCERREPGCHGKCEDYNTWLEPILKAREVRQKDNDAKSYDIGRLIKERDKKRRSKHGKS